MIADRAENGTISGLRFQVAARPGRGGVFAVSGVVGMGYADALARGSDQSPDQRAARASATALSCRTSAPPRRRRPPAACRSVDHTGHNQSRACAGSTPENHAKALDVMALYAPQITVV